MGSLLVGDRALLRDTKWFSHSHDGGGGIAKQGEHCTILEKIETSNDLWYVVRFDRRLRMNVNHKHLEFIPRAANENTPAWAKKKTKRTAFGGPIK